MTDELNIRIFNAINAWAGQNAIVDRLAIITAEFLPIIFILWMVFLWFRKDDTNKNIALLSGYSSAVGLFLNFIITLLYFHPRPFMLKIGTLLIPHAPETSFPSDHATLMFSVSMMLICFFETRKSGLILLFFAALGGLARIYCGVHFPFDIIGSAVVSAIASLSVFSIRHRSTALNKYIIDTVNRVVRI